MVKRKIYKLRKGEIIEVEEFHDGRYGAPGTPRQKKKRPTKEQIQRINELNKAKRCRHRLVEYFGEHDLFVTLTFTPDSRPPDMAAAKMDFTKFIRKVRKEYKRSGEELYWIRNIERGTRGAWHIHLVVNRIRGSGDIIMEAWPYGNVYIGRIRNNAKVYDEDMTKLANYITKSEHTTYKKADGSRGKSRISESSYSTSRNMPLPEPKQQKLIRWKAEPKAKKGYYIEKHHEGINPVTGYKYRRYTMIRLNRRI